MKSDNILHIADFQMVISLYLPNINTYIFCTAERMLRTIIMLNSRLIQTFLPAKLSRFELTDFASIVIDDVGCSQTSSVSPVRIYNEFDYLSMVGFNVKHVSKWGPQRGTTLLIRTSTEIITKTTYPQSVSALGILMFVLGTADMHHTWL